MRKCISWQEKKAILRNYEPIILLLLKSLEFKIVSESVILSLKTVQILAKTADEQITILPALKIRIWSNFISGYPNMINIISPTYLFIK